MVRQSVRHHRLTHTNQNREHPMTAQHHTENTTPTYPGHTPAPRKPWVAPAALVGAVAVGALFSGLIVNTHAQDRIEHCQTALNTTGQALDAAGDALLAASTFDLYGIDAASNKLSSLDTPDFHDSADQCRGE